MPENREIKSSFSMVDINVLKNRNLKAGPKIVYSVLTHYATIYRTCYPSYQSIAKLGGMSVSTVKRSVKKLCDEGIVSIEKRVHSSNIYKVYTSTGIEIVPGVKRSNFLMVDMGILSIDVITPAVKLTYMGILKYEYITDHSKEGGVDKGCYPSFAKIGQATGLSVRAVIEAVKQLMGCSIIEKLGNWGRSNWYDIKKGLSELSTGAQIAINGFFGDGRLNERRRHGVAEALNKYSVIDKELKESRKKEKLTTKTEYIKSKIEFDRLRVHPFIKGRLMPILHNIQSAVLELATDGVAKGYYSKDAEQYISGYKVSRIVDKININHVLETLERVNNLVKYSDIKNKRAYVKAILISVVDKHGADFEYSGMLAI